MTIVNHQKLSVRHNKLPLSALPYASIKPSLSNQTKRLQSPYETEDNLIISMTSWLLCLQNVYNNNGKASKPFLNLSQTKPRHTKRSRRQIHMIPPIRINKQVTTNYLWQWSPWWNAMRWSEINFVFLSPNGQINPIKEQTKAKYPVPSSIGYNCLPWVEAQNKNCRKKEPRSRRTEVICPWPSRITFHCFPPKSKFRKDNWIN